MIFLLGVGWSTVRIQKMLLLSGHAFSGSFARRNRCFLDFFFFFGSVLVGSSGLVDSIAHYLQDMAIRKPREPMATSFLKSPCPWADNLLFLPFGMSCAF